MKSITSSTSGLRPAMAAVVVAALALIVPASVSANTIQLITNGGFETGTLAGWTAINGAYAFIDNSYVVGSGPAAPTSGRPTVGPKSGSYYAVSDGGGQSILTLQQNFVVAPGASSVILSFDMFVNSYAPGVNGNGGLANGGPNGQQFARVDLLSAAAAPLGTTGPNLLQNFYLGVDAPLLTADPYVNYSFDITSLVSAGGAFKLRFAQHNDLFFMNQGIDNVSVQATIVPLPKTAWAGGVLFAILVGARLLHSRRAACMA